MEFIISNKYTNRYIKIINVNYIEIIQTGSPREQGFMDTRKQYIKYSIDKEPPLKFYNLEFNPNLDKLQIFK